MTEFTERLRKIELNQQETILQLDEITNLLQDDGDDEPSDRPLLTALTAFSAQIEDPYRYAAQDMDAPLFEQTRIMWHAAKTAGDAAGFEIIDDAHTPFDVGRHETESCEYEKPCPADTCFAPCDAGTRTRARYSGGRWWS